MNPKTRLVLDGKSASWRAHLGKWRTFAAVGGASLAAGTNADAGIVYSGPISESLSRPLGVTTFKSKLITIGGFKESLFAGGGAAKGYVGFTHVTASKALGFAQNASGNAAKKYSFGNPIHVLASKINATVQTNNNGAVHGSFGPGVVTGYVGFKAPNGDLGWIKVQVSDTGSTGYPNEITVLGWAYNDVSGGSIYAGQTSSGAIPEPSSLALGLLATGSVGLAALRRARTRAKVAE